MRGKAHGSLSSLKEAKARSILVMILAVCLACAFIPKAICQTGSINSFFHGGQVGNFVLFERRDGKPVGQYSAEGHTFFFLEDGTLLNDEKTARNIFLHSAVERDFIHDHNLTIITPLLNYVRFTGEDLSRDTALPVIETLSDLDCEWPFQIAVIFKGDNNEGRGYSFFARRSHNEKLEVGCGEMHKTNFVQTRLQPSPVSIYPDPISKDSFYITSNLTPCIRHFTSFGQLTRTCQNDPLFVADALDLEEAFEKLTSESLSPSATVDLIESKVRPISSLMQAERSSKE